MTIPVKVRCGKRVYDVALDTEQDVMQFKMQLFSLTNILPDKQVLLGSGEINGHITDDVSFADLSIEEGTEFLLIGSPKQVNLTASSASIDAMSTIHVGLVNLGNTCYLNSCLQVLKSSPEVCGLLSRYTSPEEYDADHRLTVQTAKVMASLNDAHKSVYPSSLLSQLRENFPQFSQKADNGSFMQQDAEEAFTQLVGALARRLKKTNLGGTVGGSDTKDRHTSEASTAEPDNWMDGLFKIGVKQTTTVEGSDAEPTVEDEMMWKLTCHIDNTISQVQAGLTASSKEKIEKTDAEGNAVVCHRETKISRLPEYLTIQYMRFWWDQRSSMKQKILRSVKYPATIDMAEFCTEELQGAIKDYRRASTAAQDVKDGLSEGTFEPPTIPAWKEGVIENNISGMYDLHAVITHKGRQADGGHYVGWAKDAQNQWQKYDDDKVTPVTEKDVLELHGGGDWHTAYLMVYKARVM